MQTPILKYKSMISMISQAALFIVFLTMFHSCEKVFMEADASDNPENIFEEIWGFTNRHYSFFEYKDIDWHQTYSRYLPLVNSRISNLDLFDICSAMLYELKDGHVNLVSSFDR